VKAATLVLTHAESLLSALACSMDIKRQAPARRAMDAHQPAGALRHQPARPVTGGTIVPSWDAPYDSEECGHSCYLAEESVTLEACDGCG
jgi:hypothetical protein